MANLPTSRIIVPADPNIEGADSGMNGGGSDSVIGICTDEPNPKETDWARIVVGATKNPIGSSDGFQSLVEYEADVFDGSPVGFAPADTIAAPGEIYATDVVGTGWDLTNKTGDYTTEVGDWLWGVVAGTGPQPTCLVYECATFQDYVLSLSPEIFLACNDNYPPPALAPGIVNTGTWGDLAQMQGNQQTNSLGTTTSSLMDTCGTGYALRIDQYESEVSRVSWRVAEHPAFETGLTGTIGGVYNGGTGSASMKGYLDVRAGDDNPNGSENDRLLQWGFNPSGPSISIKFRYSYTKSGTIYTNPKTIETTVPNHPSFASGPYLMLATWDEQTYSLYVNGNLVYRISGDPASPYFWNVYQGVPWYTTIEQFRNTSRDEIYNLAAANAGGSAGVTRWSESMFHFNDRILNLSEIVNMQLAVDQNLTGYVDPNPNCTPP